MDLVRRYTNERAIAFVKWQLVVLTSSIPHSTEVPKWCDAGPERTWKVFVGMEVAIVDGAAQAI